MKKVFIFIFLLSYSLMNAQDGWKKLKNNTYKAKSEVYYLKNIPNHYELYSLDIHQFKEVVTAKNGVSRQFNKIISLPSANGKVERFLIQESSNFSSKIAGKYGFIKSYSAQGIDDLTATAKMSVGADGVHVVIYSGKHSTFYIDPYSKDHTYAIAYKRSALESETEEYKCLLYDKELQGGESTKKEITKYNRNANDGKLRTFRLALVCTGEYAQYHLTEQGVSSSASDTEKQAAVLSAMNTTMTRVNGIYERDLSVKMNIILNANGENELIFLDPETDNLSNNSADDLIDKCQTICDDVIGDSNYDIGHVFSTAGGGLAGLGVVCISGEKASGVTGIANPLNDPFDIDFVAHEIGHQFGAHHTFNNSCNGNRFDSSAVEPGSGSTIMSYAGICDPNVQNNSDDHFHAVSIADIWDVLESSASCAAITNTGNTAPTANAGTDVTIPKSTPFVLKGVGTDVDGVSSLTYNWEQIDPEIATMSPLSTNIAGPNFRSLPSKTSPNRYMPALSTVINGDTSSTWEVLPSVAREMNFSLVVRDNHSNGGSTGRDDIKVTVADAEPFVVTAPDTEITWAVGSQQMITWDKGTSDSLPINCINVKIRLSLDGGLTFPVVLVESTPNDGSCQVDVPNTPTDNARIMVEAIDNIFYNVNSTNFIIDDRDPTFLVTNLTGAQTATDIENTSVSFTLNFDYIGGFTEDVSFSVLEEPLGSLVTFTPAVISEDATVIMELSNFKDAMAKNHIITVTASSNSVTKTVLVELNILKDYSIFPNPSNGTFNLAFSVQEKQTVKLQLYDVKGAVIERRVFNNIEKIFSKELIFETLSSGLYFLHISNGEQEVVKKILVK